MHTSKPKTKYNLLMFLMRLNVCLRHLFAAVRLSTQQNVLKSNSCVKHAHVEPDGLISVCHRTHTATHSSVIAQSGENTAAQEKERERKRKEGAEREHIKRRKAREESATVKLQIFTSS